MVAYGKGEVERSDTLLRVVPYIGIKEDEPGRRLHR